MNIRRLAPTLLLAGLTLVDQGCNRHEVVHIYSPDRSQCISVITQDTLRFIVNGEHETVPDSGYVKLEFKKVPFADCIYFCWRDADHEWAAMIDRSTVIESKLDASKHEFVTAAPLDSCGMPTIGRFRRPLCGLYIFDSETIIPDHYAIVKIR